MAAADTRLPPKKPGNLLLFVSCPPICSRGRRILSSMSATSLRLDVSRSSCPPECIRQENEDARRASGQHRSDQRVESLYMLLKSDVANAASRQIATNVMYVQC